MITAVHQPNYAPWLGYFAKIAQADIFVFLDDAQYSKNNYINRVQIDSGGAAKWLTIAVRHRFGDRINTVKVADAGWRRSHLDILRSRYEGARAFPEVWPWLSQVFAGLTSDGLAQVNETLILAIAARLDLRARVVRASETATQQYSGDDRLVAILRSIGDGLTYLSGKGGAKYQDPATFAQAGIKLKYSDFELPSYDQGNSFLPGLSIFDALFRLGFTRTAALLAPAQ
jgi:WbqC-like protein family